MVQSKSVQLPKLKGVALPDYRLPTIPGETETLGAHQVASDSVFYVLFLENLRHF